MIGNCISIARGLLVSESCSTVKLRTKQHQPSLPASLSTVNIALLESLFDHAPDVAFFVKDALGRYLAVNASLVERHGLKHKSEVVGKCSRDICPGDFGNIPSDQDAVLLRTGRPLTDHLELHWYRPHEPVWCLTTKLPIRDADGKVVGLIGFSRDVRAPIDAQEIPADFAAALEEFEHRLAEHVTPAWLARRAMLTSQRLARLTKRLFGLTPSQFITKTRIAAASRLLRETDRSISEIAGECGFYDHSAFTRAFRSAMGVPPSEFRDRA